MRIYDKYLFWQQGHDVFVEGLEASLTGSMHDPPPRVEMRRTDRVESNHEVDERWIRHERPHTRTPSVRYAPQDTRLEHHLREDDYVASLDLFIF